ncbi:MAG: galactokinase [Propionibacteriales bacterium]|nr:galactokinase [Propionibacteriales bacterium]
MSAETDLEGRPEFVDPGDPARIARRLLSAFRDWSGDEPDGVWCAPGRVNVIGEHVDYNDGICMPMALEHATYAAVRRRTDDTVRMFSTQQDQIWTGTLDGIGPGRTTGWAAYAAGVLWALRQSGLNVPGLDVVVDSRVPIGSGLSSSAALECSLGAALHDLLGVDDGRDARVRLARACMRAESEVARAPTGGMDQTIALLAEPERLLLLDCRDWSTRQLPWTDPDLTLLVIDTRTHHRLTDGQYGDRRRDCERIAALLGVGSLREVDESAIPAVSDERLRARLRHVVTEIARVREVARLLDEGALPAIGSMLDASHASLRDDYEVSCAELDVVTAAAREAGALGARMTGGGFGGSAIALVRGVDADRVAEHVRSASREADHRDPRFLLAVPSGAARRLL